MFCCANDQSSLQNQDMASPLQLLDGLQGIQVKEKVNLLEAASALMGTEVEMANKYSIQDQSGNQVFFAAESTDCCTRQLKQCFGDCAPWSVDVFQGDQKAFEISRPWTCTCLCLNRPKLEVKDVVDDAYLGAVIDPCTCCGMKFRLVDKDDNDVAAVDGGCCQCGLCCPLPCGPCSEVNFDITDASGSNVGHMTKRVPGCCKFFLASDVDNYDITFDGVSDPETKALIMATALFIDFKYFNVNNSQERTGLDEGYGGEE